MRRATNGNQAVYSAINFRKILHFAQFFLKTKKQLKCLIVKINKYHFRENIFWCKIISDFLYLRKILL